MFSKWNRLSTLAEGLFFGFSGQIFGQGHPGLSWYRADPWPTFPAAPHPRQYRPGTPQGMLATAPNRSRIEPDQLYNHRLIFNRLVGEADAKRRVTYTSQPVAYLKDTLYADGTIGSAHRAPTPATNIVQARRQEMPATGALRLRD